MVQEKGKQNKQLVKK